MNGIFVTGIGTDVGKTWVSACLCHHLKYAYFKPIQAGTLPNTDSQRILHYAPHTTIVMERHVLKMPASPHYAAAEEGVEIELSDFEWPSVDSPILVEGAGGPLVPINSKDMVIDIAVKFNLPVVLVVRHYLGSINHTLCAVEAIERRGLNIAGLVISGSEHKPSEEVILSVTGVPILARLNEVKNEDLNPEKHWTWVNKELI